MGGQGVEGALKWMGSWDVGEPGNRAGEAQSAGQHARERTSMEEIIYEIYGSG